MAENTFETQYDLTKKNKIVKFYEDNKILIYSSLITLLIIFGSVTFYFENKENNKILLSENYIQAKINLESGKKNEAISNLKELIFSNDPTYSTLSLYLILDHNLIKNEKEIISLYNHILENNKFDKEFRNLLIYKKALFSSNFSLETELLETTKTLINMDSLWKPHALLLLGDFFMSKGESIKAIEFYQKVLQINNLHRDLYARAKSQLDFIANE